VHAALDRFQHENKVEILKTAHERVNYSRPANPGLYPWNQVGERLLRLQLEILVASDAARDKTYDLNNPAPFRLNVMPPRVSGEITASGMDPEGIKDPEARRIYKERIAENERNKAKYEREKGLQWIIDDSVRSIKLTLRSPGIDDAHAKALEAVKEMVADDKLREQLLELGGE
jgi:hypothetical protein